LAARRRNATITVTAARGSTTVTGTGFTAGVDPGMFLFADTDDPYTQAYIGVVKSVDSNTSLTLVVVSGYAITARTGTFQSLRGFAPKVAKGHLTTDVAAATVTGGSTKFRSQKLDAGTVITGVLHTNTMVDGLSSTTGLTKGMPVTGTTIPANTRIASVDSGTQITLTIAATGGGAQSLTFKVPWDLYRASDMTWIGTVLSVQSEVGLTLLANAAISLADEAYVAVRADANFSLITTGTTQKVGFISANYADRQWYFNNGADFGEDRARVVLRHGRSRDRRHERLRWRLDRRGQHLERERAGSRRAGGVQRPAHVQGDRDVHRRWCLPYQLQRAQARRRWRDQRGVDPGLRGRRHLGGA